MSKVILFANTDWFLYNFRLPSAEALRVDGHEVVLVSPPGRYAPILQEKGFRWLEFPLDRRGRNPLAEAGTVFRLARLYRKERPALVHHFTIKCVLYGTLAARFSGVPAVVNSLTGLGYIFMGRWSLLRVWVGLAYRFLLRNTATIFENPSDQALFLQNGWVIPERSTVILGAGVDTELFHSVPEPGGVPTVVLPARLLWDKGVGEFVEAARVLRGKGVRARFVLVGETDPGNPTEVPMRTLKGWRQEDVVEWLPWQDDMASVYSAAHIVCLPSYREGLSRTLIEAAASGRPIVTTDVPGCREVVLHGVNGLLVPPADASALAEALAVLIADPALRGRMGQNSRARAVEYFKLQKITQETLAFYNRIIDHTSG